MIYIELIHCTLSCRVYIELNQWIHLLHLLYAYQVGLTSAILFIRYTFLKHLQNYIKKSDIHPTFNLPCSYASLQVEGYRKNESSPWMVLETRGEDTWLWAYYKLTKYCYRCLSFDQRHVQDKNILYNPAEQNILLVYITICYFVHTDSLYILVYINQISTEIRKIIARTQFTMMSSIVSNS